MRNKQIGKIVAVPVYQLLLASISDKPACLAVHHHRQENAPGGWCQFLSPEGIFYSFFDSTVHFLYTYDFTIRLMEFVEHFIHLL